MAITGRWRNLFPFASSKCRTEHQAGPFTWNTDNLGSFQANLRSQSVDLLPGNYITVTDDVTGVMKDLLLPALTIDYLDVQHLIFSDGFASVSVFIEPGPAKGPAPPESATVGSANAFSTQVGGHVVTAVGEVPAATVRDIALSLAPIDVAASPAKPVSEPKNH